MGSISEDELDARMTLAKPHEGIGGEPSVRSALDGLLLGVVGLDPPAHHRPRPVGPRRLVTSMAVAIAVAIAALVGVGISGVGSGGSELVAVPAAQAAELNQLAHTAASQAAGPTDAQWLYQRVLVSGATTLTLVYGPHRGSHISYRYEFRDESWVGILPNSGVAVLPSGAPAGQHACCGSDSSFGIESDSTGGHLTIPDQAERRLAGPEMLQHVDSGDMGAAGNEVSGGPATVPPQEFSSLPTAPRPLVVSLRRLLSDGWPHTDELTGSQMTEPTALWRSLLSILERSTGPKLRAAAYQALASLPDLTVLGTMRDAQGRPGTAIEYAGQTGLKQVIIVNPRTTEVLQDTQTATRPELGWPTGTLLLREVWLLHSIVNAEGAEPAGAKPLGASSAR